MKTQFNYKYDDLFNVLLKALQNLGGSGSNAEIEEQVSTILNLTEDQVNEIHKGNLTKFAYGLAWAKFYLKKYGLIENSIRGIWSLTNSGLETKEVDKDLVKRTVLVNYNREKKIKKIEKNKLSQFQEFREELEEEEEEEAEKDSEEIQKLTWQEQIIEEILKISPQAFERLCQRLLRELGFLNVIVSGKANDGGIDGKGMIRIGGVLSFHVVFQAKRYSGSVSASVVRDFRGAMMGRADKGLILTTGTFTREAKKESQRDGAPPIDLIDGHEFAEKLKELKLGIEIEQIEKVTINSDWFNKI